MQEQKTSSRLKFPSFFLLNNRQINNYLTTTSVASHNEAAFALRGDDNNPLLGAGAFVQPIGRSGYDALQVVYRQQKLHPFRYTDSANIQVSYSHSRIISTGTAGGGTAGS